MNPTYEIIDWNERFENSRSRSVKSLDWVAVPNSHDGEGYSRVMAHSRSAEVFAAWVLILQVASKCVVRGKLLRENGKPHTPETLALKTRAPMEWFAMAFDVLSDPDIGWLSASHQEGVAQLSPAAEPEIPAMTAGYQEGDTLPSPCHQDDDGTLTASHQEGVTEWKGMEEKGREGNNPSCVPPSIETEQSQVACESPPVWWKDDPGSWEAELCESVRSAKGYEHVEPNQERVSELIRYVQPIAPSREEFTLTLEAFVERAAGKRKPEYVDPVRTLRAWFGREEARWRSVKRQRGYDGQTSPPRAAAARSPMSLAAGVLARGEAQQVPF